MLEIADAQAQHIGQPAIAKTRNEHAISGAQILETVGVGPVRDACARIVRFLHSEADRQNHLVERRVVRGVGPGQPRNLFLEHHPKFPVDGLDTSNLAAQTLDQAGITGDQVLPLRANRRGNPTGRACIPVEDRQIRTRLERPWVRPIVDTRVQPAIRRLILQPQGPMGAVEDRHVRQQSARRVCCRRQARKPRADDGDAPPAQLSIVRPGQRVDQIDGARLLRIDRDVPVERAEQVDMLGPSGHIAEKVCRALRADVIEPGRAHDDRDRSPNHRGAAGAATRHAGQNIEGRVTQPSRPIDEALICVTGTCNVHGRRAPERDHARAAFADTRRRTLPW
jgi:hypothetical protein